jgi:hypothetical protein
LIAEGFKSTAVCKSDPNKKILAFDDKNTIPNVVAEVYWQADSKGRIARTRGFVRHIFSDSHEHLPYDEPLRRLLASSPGENLPQAAELEYGFRPQSDGQYTYHLPGAPALKGHNDPF